MALENWAAQFSAGAPVWALQFGALSAPSAPADVAGTATSDTTATLTLTDTNSAAASYRWQIAPVSTGVYVDASGATNPSAAGVAAFAATGLTAATEYLVRARGENGGGNSAYAVGAASFTTDNPGSGGGEIPATLTATLTIGAALQAARTASCTLSAYLQSGPVVRSAAPSGNGPAQARRGRNLSTSTR